MLVLTHDAEDPIGRSCQGVPRPSIFGRKDLGCVSVKDGVHERREEVVCAVPTQQRIAILRGRTGEDEDPSESRRKGQSPFTSE